MMTVFDPTRQIGVLAALGMKRRQVTGLFLLQATLLGVVGASIVCQIGVALLAWLKQVGIGMPSVSGMGDVVALMGDRIYPSVNLAGVISRAAIVAIMAAIASLYPAWQASRKQPAEALHHV